MSVLSLHSSLTALDLRGNQLTASGAAVVASAMASHPSLQSLRLSFDVDKMIDASTYTELPSAATALVQLLISNQSLTRLEWSGPCFAADIFRVEQALWINTGLTRFHLQLGDSVLDSAIHALALGDRLAFRRVLMPTAATGVENTSDSQFLVAQDELTVGGELGRGLFCSWHECDWQGHDHTVCIKIYAGGDERGVRVAMHEFALLHELGLDNAAALAPHCVFAERFLVTVAHDELRVVVPWMNGGSLRALPICASATVRVELLAQAAQSLAMIHAHGVVHRDVTDRHFLVQQMGDGMFRVKLSHFAWACPLHRPGMWQDLAPPDIWPPEVVTLELPFGYAGDVFAFGLLLVDVLNRGVVWGELDHAAVVVSGPHVPALDVEAFVKACEDGVADAHPDRARVPSADHMEAVVVAALSQQPIPGFDSHQLRERLQSWDLRRSLHDPVTALPGLPLLIQWCTHPVPSERPSMRMVACLLRLMVIRDLQALPDIFMTSDVAAAPDCIADWSLVWYLCLRPPKTVTKKLQDAFRQLMASSKSALASPPTSPLISPLATGTPSPSRTQVLAPVDLSVSMSLQSPTINKLRDGFRKLQASRADDAAVETLPVLRASPSNSSQSATTSPIIASGSPQTAKAVVVAPQAGPELLWGGKPISFSAMCALAELLPVRVSIDMCVIVWQWWLCLSSFCVFGMLTLFWSSSVICELIHRMPVERRGGYEFKWTS